MNVRRGLAGAVGALLLVSVAPVTAQGETTVDRFFYEANATLPPGEEIYSAAGLTITALCEPLPPPWPTAIPTLLARSEVEDATLHFARHQEPDVFTYVEEDDLDPGEEVILAQLTEPGEDFFGELAYTRPDGAVATIDLAGVRTQAYPGVPNCRAYGVGRWATATPEGSGKTRSISFSADPGDSATLVETSGLRIDASCTADNGVELNASLTGSGRFLATSRSDEGRSAASDTTLDNLVVDDAVGQMVYAGDGPTVTIDWLGENDEGNGGGSPCLLAGTARVESPPSARAIDFRAPTGTDEMLFKAMHYSQVEAQCDEAGQVNLDVWFGVSGSSLYITGTPDLAPGGFFGIYRSPGGGDHYLDLIDEALGTSAETLGTGQLLIAGVGLNARPISIDYMAAEGSVGDDLLDQPCALVGTMDAVGDTEGPDTRIAPKREETSSRRPWFRFGLSANSSDVSAKAFFCRLDGKPAAGRKCESSYRSPRLSRGRHLFEVWAVDYFGNVGPKARDRFRVR